MPATRTITEPTDEPIEVLEAQEYMELDSDTDSELIRSLIIAARTDIENRLGRAFLNRTMQTTLDRIISNDVPITSGWSTGADVRYCADYVELPMGPLVEITEVRWFDRDNASHIFASDNYRADTNKGRLILNQGREWPRGMRDLDSLQITYVAGGATQGESVNEAVRLAVRLHVAHAYENRGGSADTPEPVAIGRLIAPYAVVRL